jgi:glutamyl-tRNA synthetase
VLFPPDVEPLVRIVCERDVAPDETAAREIAAAGRAFFEQAAVAWQTHGPDFKAWTRAVSAATGRKGAALFMPLRAALTGSTHGPELAPLAGLMGPERVGERILAAGARATAA